MCLKVTQALQLCCQTNHQFSFAFWFLFDQLLPLLTSVQPLVKSATATSTLSPPLMLKNMLLPNKTIRALTPAEKAFLEDIERDSNYFGQERREQIGIDKIPYSNHNPEDKEVPEEIRNAQIVERYFLIVTLLISAASLAGAIYLYVFWKKRRRADVVFNESTAPEIEEVHAESSSSRSVTLIVQLPKAEDLPPTYDETAFQNNNFCNGSYSETKLINDYLKEELSSLPPPNYEDALGNFNLKESIDSESF